MYEVLIQKQYDYSLLRFPEMESLKIIPKPLPEMSSSLESLNKYLPIRWHKTTTWTNFDPILTPSLPRVDKRGHSTYPPPCPRGQNGQKRPPPLHKKYSIEFKVM